MNAVASTTDEVMYFEDIPIERVFTTSGRTVTEADVVGFAGLSADYNSLHVDAHYAARTPFGQRIAHGLLVVSIASGLTTRLPVFSRLQSSLLGMTSMACTWPAPTHIGDTLHVELSFTAPTLTRSGSRGVVTERRVARKQDGTVVLDSEWKLLVARRPVDHE